MQVGHTSLPYIELKHKRGVLKNRTSYSFGTLSGVVSPPIHGPVAITETASIYSVRASDGQAEDDLLKAV